MAVVGQVLQQTSEPLQIFQVGFRAQERILIAQRANQSGQGNAGTHHIGSEGVSKTVGVGLGDLARATMMTKQRAQSPRRSWGSRVGGLSSKQTGEASW